VYGINSIMLIPLATPEYMKNNFTSEQRKEEEKL
jgi:hypothetical protein